MKNLKSVIFALTSVVCLIFLGSCENPGNTEKDGSASDDKVIFNETYTEKETDVNESETGEDMIEENVFYMTAGQVTFRAYFADNSSALKFKEKLADGDVTVFMHDYGNFEKVGQLGFSLPRNDTRITTEPGDVILYQGNQITVYYDTNTWSFTRLGKIENASREELLSAFGDGEVNVTFSLSQP